MGELEYGRFPELLDSSATLSAGASSPSAFTSGRGAKNAIIPRITKANMIIRKGYSRSEMPILFTSFPMSHTMNIDGIGQASLLQIPIILIRLAALSNGPSMVIYGFTEACR